MGRTDMGSTDMASKSAACPRIVQQHRTRRPCTDLCNHTGPTLLLWQLANKLLLAAHSRYQAMRMKSRVRQKTTSPLIRYQAISQSVEERAPDEKS
eukprot:65018-Pelagomonas_calceolata.AAC.2